MWQQFASGNSTFVFCFIVFCPNCNFKVTTPYATNRGAISFNSISMHKMCKKSMNGKFKYMYVQNNRTTHGELHFGEATKTKHNKRYIYFHVWGKRKGSVLRGSFRATWNYFAPRYLQASPLYVTVKTLVLFVYVQFIKKWSFLFKVNRLLKEKKILTNGTVVVSRCSSYVPMWRLNIHAWKMCLIADGRHNAKRRWDVQANSCTFIRLATSYREDVGAISCR